MSLDADMSFWPPQSTVEGRDRSNAVPDITTEGLRFSKYGLWFRSGASVDVVIVDGPPGSRLFYDKGVGQAVRTPAGCNDGSTWQQVPGGYLVPEPACLTIEVRQNGQSARAVIPVGRSC